MRSERHQSPSGPASAQGRGEYAIISTATDSVELVEASEGLGAFYRWLRQKGWHVGYGFAECISRPDTPFCEGRFADGDVAERAIIVATEELSSIEELL